MKEGEIDLGFMLRPTQHGDGWEDYCDERPDI
jgi:hypothetical protein